MDRSHSSGPETVKHFFGDHFAGDISVFAGAVVQQVVIGMIAVVIALTIARRSANSTKSRWQRGTEEREGVLSQGNSYLRHQCGGPAAKTKQEVPTRTTESTLGARQNSSPATQRDAAGVHTTEEGSSSSHNSLPATRSEREVGGVGGTARRVVRYGNFLQRSARVAEQRARQQERDDASLTQQHSRNPEVATTFQRGAARRAELARQQYQDRAGSASLTQQEHSRQVELAIYGGANKRVTSHDHSASSYCGPHRLRSCPRCATTAPAMDGPVSEQVVRHHAAEVPLLRLHHRLNQDLGSPAAAGGAHAAPLAHQDGSPALPAPLAHQQYYGSQLHLQTSRQSNSPVDGPHQHDPRGPPPAPETRTSTNNLPTAAGGKRRLPAYNRGPRTIEYQQEAARGPRTITAAVADRSSMNSVSRDNC